MFINFVIKKFVEIIVNDFLKYFV